MKRAITPPQSRAARGLLSWSRDQLAEVSSVPPRTVADFELGNTTPRESTVMKLRAALETAGVEFIPENGGDAGVRLRRFQVGDLVKLRGNSRYLLDPIKRGEIGKVVWVESHPHETGPTYRMSVEFERATITGVFKSEFELVKGSQ